jgi:hypothetical protein
MNQKALDLMAELDGAVNEALAENDKRNRERDEALIELNQLRNPNLPKREPRFRDSHALTNMIRISRKLRAALSEGT